MKKIHISKFINHNSGKGFTLIELLIFMGIFSILMTALFQLLIAVFDVQLESQSVSAVEQDGRYIINKLTNDIKNTNTIISPNAGVYAQTLSASDTQTTYTYTLTNGNLTLHNSLLNTTDQLNSVNTTVTSLNFLRLSDATNQANTITVYFTLNSVTEKRSGTNGKDFSVTVGTR